ncbi:MAG: hypothetical protein ABMA26_08005 [Limisphaerales bacterium]
MLSLLSACVTAITLVAAEPATPPAFQIRLVQDVPNPNTEQMTITHSVTDTNRTTAEVLNVQKMPLMDHTAVRSAVVQKHRTTGDPLIEVTFTDSGRKLFADVTRRNSGKRLAILVDGKLLSAPKVMMEIPNGIAVINGRFSERDAIEFATKVNNALKK